MNRGERFFNTSKGLPRVQAYYRPPDEDFILSDPGNHFEIVILLRSAQTLRDNGHKYKVSRINEDDENKKQIKLQAANDHLDIIEDIMIEANCTKREMLDK